MKTHILLFIAALTFSTSLMAQNESEIRPDGIVFPRMTTSARDSLTATFGQVLYNTSTSQFEYYDGILWQSLSSSALMDMIGDADGDTKIEVEKSADEDTIRFTVGGIEIGKLNNKAFELEAPGFSTFIGTKAGRIDDGTDNYNVAVGNNTGESLTSGFSNTLIGANAGNVNATGSYNTYLGTSAGYKNTASENTMLGHRAGFENVTGQRNVFVGSQTGRNNTGSDNVFIGNRAGEDETGSHKLIIANNANSNLISGNFIDSLIGLNGKVAIGHENPETELDIRTDTSFVQVKLLPKLIYPMESRSEIIMLTNESSQEGYSIASKAILTFGGFPPVPDTARYLDFRYIDENGAKSTRLQVGKDYVSIRPGTELFVNEKATFKEDIFINNTNSDTTAIVFNGSTTKGSITSSSLSMNIINEENTKLNFWTNNQNRMTLDNSGKLGLGTDSPVATLDVRGDAVFNEDAQDADFRVEGTLYNSLFFVDASTNNIGIRSFSPVKTLTVGGDALFSDTVTFQKPPILEAYIDNASLKMKTGDGSEGSVILRENGTHVVAMGDVDPTGGNLVLRANGSNIMTLLQNGNVGIGTSSPTKKLDVNGNAQILGELDIVHGSANGLGMKIINSANSKHWVLHTDDNASAFMRIYSSAGGNVHVGRFDSSSGVYTATSDKRKKQNIDEVQNLLQDVLSLDVRKYTYKNDIRQKERIGFIAQDVEAYFPQFVEYDEEEDIYTMDYAGLSAVAIKAIQEQHAIIENYKSEVDALKKEMQEIRTFFQSQYTDE